MEDRDQMRAEDTQLAESGTGAEVPNAAEETPPVLDAGAEEPAAVVPAGEHPELAESGTGAQVANVAEEMPPVLDAGAVPDREAHAAVAEALAEGASQEPAAQANTSEVDDRPDTPTETGLEAGEQPELAESGTGAQVANVAEEMPPLLDAADREAQTAVSEAMADGADGAPVSEVDEVGGGEHPELAESGTGAQVANVAEEMPPLLDAGAVPDREAQTAVAQALAEGAEPAVTPAQAAPSEDPELAKSGTGEQVANVAEEMPPLIDAGDVAMAEGAAAAMAEALPEQLYIEQPQAAEEAEIARTLAVLEAIVYITDEPLSAEQIARALNRPLPDVRALLDRLVAEYNKAEHGLTVREVAGGYKMATKPEHHEAVREFVKNLNPPLKLSLAALETLAVIAYKQPITAPEVMEIRGVQGAGVLKTLIDRKLITTAGRKNVVGKPILYKTTKEFLVQFGLKDLAELPTLKEFEDLRRMAFADADELPAAPEPAPAEEAGVAEETPVEETHE